VQGVLARLVREVGDAGAVGGPGRRALMHAWGAGQVADIPLVGGDGHDLAAGLEHGPHACGRQAGVADRARGLHPAGPHLGEVAPQGDGHPLAARRLQVVQVQTAELLVGDGAGPGRGALEIEALVLDDLADLAGGGVVGKERERAVPVGEEVDRVAHPHGVVVVGVVARDLLAGEAVEGDDPDVARGTAPVALPGVEGRGERGVGDAPAVGRVAARLGFVDRELGGEAAFFRHGEQLVGAGEAGPAGVEQDGGTVGRPSHRQIPVRVIGEPLGHTPLGRDDEDVPVAVVLAGEGD